MVLFKLWISLIDFSRGMFPDISNLAWWFKMVKGKSGKMASLAPERVSMKAIKRGYNKLKRREENEGGIIGRRITGISSLLQGEWEFKNCESIPKRFLDLSEHQLIDGDASVVVDSVGKRDGVDSGEESVGKSEGEHGGDVSTSILCRGRNNYQWSQKEYGKRHTNVKKKGSVYAMSEEQKIGKMGRERFLGGEKIAKRRHAKDASFAASRSKGTISKWREKV